MKKPRITEQGLDAIDGAGFCSTDERDINVGSSQEQGKGGGSTAKTADFTGVKTIVLAGTFSTLPIFDC